MSNADKHPQFFGRTVSFIFNDGDVLLMKAAEHKSWAGTYNPPGGHIEEGENVLKAAIREIKEETGLDLPETKIRGIITTTGFFGENDILFVTESHSDTREVQSNDEGELIWVPTDKLDGYRMFEDVKPMLKHLQEMKNGQICIGTVEYDGNDQLVAIDMEVM